VFLGGERKCISRLRVHKRHCQEATGCLQLPHGAVSAGCAVVCCGCAVTTCHCECV
jgi:hypothetical protein